jgi:hypothetical protein
MQSSEPGGAVVDIGNVQEVQSKRDLKYCNPSGDGVSLAL